MIFQRPTRGTLHSDARLGGSFCERSTPASRRSGGIRKPTGSLIAEFAERCCVVFRMACSSRCSPTTSSSTPYFTVRETRSHGSAERTPNLPLQGTGFAGR